MIEPKWEIRVFKIGPDNWSWALLDGILVCAHCAGMEADTKEDAIEDAKWFRDRIGSKWPIEIKGD